MDYGDNDDVDVEVASQVLPAGDDKSKWLLEMLVEEQCRMSQQLEEALAKGTAEVLFALFTKSHDPPRRPLLKSLPSKPEP